MKHSLLAIIIAGFALCGLSSCHPLYVIDKGCIKDDFSISFNDRNIKIKPNQFFTLEQSGLMANPNRLQPTLKTLHEYSKQFVNYKITINRPGDGKPYYGRLAFFAIPKEMRDQAVASFYKISIPASYFEQAEDGRTAFVYEYYADGRVNWPTWIVWLSDVPI